MLVALATALASSACSSSEPPPPAAQDAGPAEAGVSPDAAAAPDLGTAAAPDAAPQDAAAAPIVDMCNPLTQMGCPSSVADGGVSKCVVENQTPRGGAVCVPARSTDKPVNAACQGRDCLPGLVCVRNSTTAGASCRKICDRAATQTSTLGCAGLPGGDHDCLAGVRDTNWSYCVRIPAACDAHTQVPCAMTEACQPFQRANGTFDLRCRLAGTATQGASCASMDCARRHLCVNERNVARCRRVCQSAAECRMALTMTSSCTGEVPAVALRYCLP